MARTSVLEEPGDYTPFTVPEGPGPHRIRWTYRTRETDADGLYIDRPDEVRSKPGESGTSCWQRAMRKIDAMQLRERSSGDGEMRLRVLLAKFRTSRLGLSARTAIDYDQSIKRLALRLGSQMDAMIGHLDPFKLQEAFSPANGCTGSRRDTAAVSYLRSALKFAGQTRLLSGPNPAGLLHAPEYDTNTKAPMSDDMIAKVLTADWNPEELWYWVFSYYSAARGCEVLGARWSDRRTWGDYLSATGRPLFPKSTVPMLHLRQKASSIGDVSDMRLKNVWERKTGRGLTLTPFIMKLMDDARAHQLARGYDGDLMFPATDGGYQGSGYYKPSTWRTQRYDRMMLAIGAAEEIAAKPRRGNKQGYIIRAEYTPHELRHSGMTIREELRLNKYMQYETGHKVQGESSVHAGYVNLRPEKRLEESMIVSNYLQKIVMRGKIPFNSAA